MTTEQLGDIEQLARRAVACKHWRWMRGMLTKRSRVVRIKLDSTIETWNPGDWIEGLPNDALPDLRDAATMGCLLALVREAWGNPTVTTARTHPFSGSRPWVVGISMRAFYGQTEAAALVAALEAAP